MARQTPFIPRLPDQLCHWVHQTHPNLGIPASHSQAVAGNCRLAAHTDYCRGILAAGIWTRFQFVPVSLVFRAHMSHAQGHVLMIVVH